MKIIIPAVVIAAFHEATVRTSEAIQAEISVLNLKQEVYDSVKIPSLATVLEEKVIADHAIGKIEITSDKELVIDINPAFAVDVCNGVTKCAHTFVAAAVAGVKYFALNQKVSEDICKKWGLTKAS